MKKQTPFYDPERSYEDNFTYGPFGAFADHKVMPSSTPPAYTFLGQKVHLPFGIAAGPLVNRTFTKAALEKGFDIVVYKTVRTAEHRSHAWPNVVPVSIKGNLSHKEALEGIVATDKYDSTMGITNSFGVPSADPSFWQKDMALAVQDATSGQLVIGSFQGTLRKTDTLDQFIQDFATAAKLVKETGVKVMEANLSCPNEGTSHLLCFDIPRVKKIVTEIKKVIGTTPLILKIAYFEDPEQFETFIREIGPLVEGLSMINTIPAKVVDKHGKQRLPGENRLISGICGKPIQWAGIDMVERAYLLREKMNLSFAIIGVGGVTEPADYTAYINAGADAVMCATGAMWNPYLALDIKNNEKNI